MRSTPAAVELLTVAEVAELLRTTPNALYVMAAHRKLPGAVTLGRRLLVNRAALVEWLACQECAPIAGK
jgi:excisionase family DNA binding protein